MKLKIIILLVTGICFFGACSTSTNDNEQIAHTAIDDTIVKTDTSSFEMDSLLDYLDELEKNMKKSLDDSEKKLEESEKKLDDAKNRSEAINDLINGLDTTKTN